MSASKPQLLVIDDGDRYLELLEALLPEYTYIHARDWEEAQRVLGRRHTLDAVLLDVNFELPEARLLPLPDGLGAGLPDARQRLQGLAILARLRRDHAALPVVLMTSTAELDKARVREQLDSDEYLTLAGADAFDARAMGLLVERILARRAEADAGEDYVFGESAAMARLRRDATTLARTSLPMLVVGEPGTGKSALAAQVIHRASGREGAFVSVDLSALPKELVAAELFGAARGAFSGATDRVGRFEAADGGTLLLDEIGHLSMDAQRMLLLVLQEQRVTRVGENTPRDVDVKLIAATNADLAAEVRAGRFRPDLYARLNPAARLRIPPLRERREDIPALMDAAVRAAFASKADAALLRRYAELVGMHARTQPALQVGAGETPSRRVVFVISQGAGRAIERHAFPGNVRELTLLVRTACLMALGDAITAAEGERAAAGDAATIPIPDRLVDELLEASWIPPVVGGDEAVVGALPRPQPRGKLRDVARELERAMFEALYAEAHGDFRLMASWLLLGDPDANARRVRLRFNQLGLRVRER